MVITGKTGSAVSYTIHAGEIPEMLSLKDLVDRSGKTERNIMELVTQGAIPCAGHIDGRPVFYRNAEAFARSSFAVMPGQPIAGHRTTTKGVASDSIQSR